MQTHLNVVVSTGHCCLVKLSLPDRNEQKMKNFACMMTTLSGPRVPVMAIGQATRVHHGKVVPFPIRSAA